MIASHAGYRSGAPDYLLDEQRCSSSCRRDGVVGLILAQYQLNDGIRHDDTTTFEQTIDVIWRHIDKIAEVTGGHDTSRSARTSTASSSRR